MDSAPSSYKELKEAWIADQSGSSVHRINLLGLTMFTTYAVWGALRAASLRQARQGGGSPLGTVLRAASAVPNWWLEFLVLVLPAIVAHTVLSDRLVLLNLVLASLATYVSMLGTAPFGSQGHSDHRIKPRDDAVPAQRQRHWSKRVSDDEDDYEGAELVGFGMDPERRLAFEAPIRVSVDSAADAAHAAAAPPIPYFGPSASADSEPSSSTSFSATAASALAPPHEDGAGLGLLSSDSALDRSLLDGLDQTDTLAVATAGHRGFEPVPDSRLFSPLLDGSSHRGRTSLSSTSPLSPLARSIIDPLDNSRRAASKRRPARIDLSDRFLFVREQPFLTVYRSHMMLLTSICILAVDFPVFPRAFAKCESWGTSLMDLGVGSFVFSLGIVSALPFLRSPRNRFSPLKGQLIRDFRRSLPLILLGLMRVVMVKGIEYPEHVSEYGVHWNFFFTLALLPFSVTFSRPFSRWIRHHHLALLIAVIHFATLKLTDLEAWALSSTLARDTLLRQNKEGIVSLPGYLAIFLLGVDLGHYVLPLDPYFAYRKLGKRRMKPKPGKLAMILASLSVLWWSGYALVCALGWQTSRRLANLPYVLWVTAFNTSCLLAYVLVYLRILRPVELETSRVRTEAISADAAVGAASSAAAIQALSVDVTPSLLADLNRHSLAVFLAANLLTGLVNVTIQTMFTSDLTAVAILIGYTAASCGLARMMSRMGWRLKL